MFCAQCPVASPCAFEYFYQKVLIVVISTEDEETHPQELPGSSTMLPFKKGYTHIIFGIWYKTPLLSFENTVVKNSARLCPKLMDFILIVSYPKHVKIIVLHIFL